ncbi:blue copper protein 1a-like [Zingiber officinale]|uniref:blue copper protein 1a-like n=1 Tax=Zingiber officinale TaxID=94328 RepID=UPI001C4B1AA8|nr:blue copper protein 1a-like [Zingiber officinale]
MASRQEFVVVLIATAVAVLPFAMAADIVIGGQDGWKPDFNYTNWASSMEFRVGDQIVFNYTRGGDNVIPVGGDEFKACNASESSNVVLTSGHDVLLLNSEGRRWYLSGVGDHCLRGQKLVINVVPAATPPPTTPPTPTPTTPPTPTPTLPPPIPSSPSPSPWSPLPPTPQPSNDVPPPSSSLRITADVYQILLLVATTAMIVKA